MVTAVAILAALVLLTIGVGCVLLRRHFVVIEVYGSSMLPTLSQGDRVLVRRVASSAVRAGDIVVLDAVDLDRHRDHRPTGGALRHRAWIIKRASAVAGDPVPPSVAPAIGVPAGTAVPLGSLVVLGDNPASSGDSRYWGYLPADRLLGVVLRRI